MIRHGARVLLLTVLAMIGHVRSHSWIACADYTEKNAGDWDSSKCRGYPRDAANYAPKDAFGLDRGFDHKPGQMGKACKTTYSASSYSAAYPKAVYYPGQQVILVHPMKNHGAASCTNKHIPDFGNRIYRGRPGRDRDEIYSFYKNMLVADLGISRTGSANSAPDTYPKPGYQNAPNFCDNTDKAMATYSYNVPMDLAPGEYTFVWRWSFNGPSDIYTTCFDVEIAADKPTRDRTLLQRNPSIDLSVPCGGTLSNEEEGSSEGCDGVVVTLPPPVTTQRPTRPPRPITQPTTGGERNVPVKAYQLSGEVDLGEPSSDVKRRFASVHFECPAQVSFWNARLVRKHNHEGGRMKRHVAIHHDLVQESAKDVASGKIYFTATFEDACNTVSSPPTAKLVRDEK